MLIVDIGFLGWIFVFIFATTIGSFLNVVIYRVPAGKSIVKPGSYCPQCSRPIKPWENIPIISYLLLRGNCAGCKSSISIRYPAVELIMGLLALILYSKFGPTIEFLYFSVMSAVLLALSVIDIDTYRLPNPITLTGAIIAVILTLVLRREYIIDMLLGGLVGFGMLAVMGLLGTLLFRKETLGMGDVKLAAMIGLYLGPFQTAGMFILGAFSAAIIGGAIIIAGGKKWKGNMIPFGPYLALGSIVSLMWGQQLWNMYVSFAFR